MNVVLRDWQIKNRLTGPYEEAESKSQTHNMSRLSRDKNHIKIQQKFFYG